MPWASGRNVGSLSFSGLRTPAVIEVMHHSCIAYFEGCAIPLRLSTAVCINYEADDTAQW